MNPYWSAALMLAASILYALHKRKSDKPKPQPAQKCIRCAQTPIMSRVDAEVAIRDAAARTDAVATVALTLGAHLAYQGLVDEPDEAALLKAKKACADLGIDWSF